MVVATIVAMAGCAGQAPGRRASTAAAPLAAATAATVSTSPRIAAGPEAPVPPASPPRAPLGPVALTGCPPPPRHLPPGKPPWHPAVLVPDAALPTPAPPATREVTLGPLSGKGMWIWQMKATEHGDVDAIVARARTMGLAQLWVRVGDTQDGFYAAPTLESLLPAAHRAGLAVMGWGFPHLYDPLADASWSLDALSFRSSAGDRLDGFSADIETSGEGVALSGLRAQIYLSALGTVAGRRPIVATVFPPTEHWMASYPYAQMAPYVDAFAPMVYWGCREPGSAVSEAIARLARLAPVHVIGQAYNMGPEGGRQVAPSGDEIARFLDVAQRGGAAGASLWDWQEASTDEWLALAGYSWPRSPASARPVH